MEFGAWELEFLNIVGYLIDLKFVKKRKKSNMSDLLKVMIGLVLWFLSFLIMYNFVWRPDCGRMPFCGSSQVAAVAPPVVTEDKAERAPLDCQWSDASGYTNDGFDDFKMDILSGAGDNNILEIVGLYYGEEENTTDFEDVGLARANQIKDLFIDDLGEDRIQLKSIQLDADDTAKEGYHACAEFNWIEGEAGPVEILEDRAIIRFPYNSVQKDFNPKIDEYLAGLAQTLKDSGGTVRLTGHTDDRGAADRNETLAHRRAKMIRDILRDKGVRRSQILTFTKGETEPIATNDTEEGRHQNRRVVVQLD